MDIAIARDFGLYLYLEINSCLKISNKGDMIDDKKTQKYLVSIFLFNAIFY